ncbi:MAG TPA: SgcJ/EcaC family oxidoreductase [Pirellulales bacterium]|nr:SgcJ/EcaC family oxidoreductase [Pirellulales bacterium]
MISQSTIKSFARAAIAMVAAALPIQAAENTSDEEAIRASVASYVDAYNRGDAKAVADHWSDTGQWTSPSGERFNGREAIETQLAKLFADGPGTHLEVAGLSVRIVAPDAAIEEGTVRVERPGGELNNASYVAVHVKQGGQWKLDSVYETDESQARAEAAPLQELAWLVGHWVDQSDDAALDATVTWTKNQTFLNYAFKASVPGADDLEGTQVIGWDPAAGTIRSWMFDSDGGFGQGTWSKSGNRWTVKFEQVLADGRQASATNIYTLVGPDTCTWSSIGRKLDGEYLPNVEDMKLVRTSSSTAAD